MSAQKAQLKDEPFPQTEAQELPELFNEDGLFDLKGDVPEQRQDFELEMETQVNEQPEPAPQIEFYLPESDPEQPEPSDQLELEGMPKPVHMVQIKGRSVPARHQHARTLLESLEAQDIQVPYQCREGYCGSCRTLLLEGDVAYLEEPMAWVNEGEILPCCCVPKGDISIKVSD